MKREIRERSKIIVIYLMLSILTLALAGFLILDNITYPVTKFDPQPFQVLTPNVKRGEELVYRYHYCKTANFELISVQKQLLDGQIIELTDKSRTPHQMGCHTVERHTTIPKSVSPDRYELKITSTFKVNFFKTVQVTTNTEYFNVVD